MDTKTKVNTDCEKVLPDLDTEDENDSPPEGIQLDEVFERLYKRIRLLASRIRWNAPTVTVTATTLAHEAYLKLKKHPKDLTSRSNDEIISIFGYAMQQILIDIVRRKATQKRVVVDIPRQAALPIEDALTVSAALEQLEREDHRLVQVVRCRFFLGMTNEETAAALRTSTRTVDREWKTARSRLRIVFEGAA